MERLEDLKAILSSKKGELRQKYGVKEIGLFGSYIRGEERESSDLDVLVEFERPVDFFLFLELEEELQRILRVKVDLVRRKVLKPFVKEHVLKEVVYV